MAFLIFSSVLGPMVAFYMAQGGGANLAHFAAAKTISVLSNTVQAGTSLATAGAGGMGSLLGKSLAGKGLARRSTRPSR